MYPTSESAESIKNDLNAQMKEQIIISYEAVKSKLRFVKQSFELVGYDFMVVPSEVP